MKVIFELISVRCGHCDYLPRYATADVMFLHSHVHTFTVSGACLLACLLAFLLSFSMQVLLISCRPQVAMVHYQTL